MSNQKYLQKCILLKIPNMSDVWIIYRLLKKQKNN